MAHAVIGAEHERAQAGGEAGFGDAVTFAFGAASERLYGTARLGLVPGEPVRASGLALLLADGEVAAVDASGGVELEAADWTRLDAGDVSAEIVEPLRSWQVRYDGDEGGFELRYEALGPPADLGAGALARTAGLHGYEQLCRVRGTVRHGGRRTRIDCLGQRGHQWGAPDWDAIERSRTIGVWLDGGLGATVAAVRPAGAEGHGEEAVAAFVFEDGAVAAVEDPRVSTTADAAGRQVRASLELWRGDDDGPHRIAGEAVCGTTLDLGRLRLDCAFFRWRGEGREGVGRYDVLRRA